MLLVAPVAVAKPVKRHLGAGIEGKYIVLFPNETAGSAVDGLARSLAGTYNLEVTTTWQYVKGFVALGSLEAATALADDPRVELVEQDVLMRDQQANPEPVVTSRLAQNDQICQRSGPSI